MVENTQANKESGRILIVEDEIEIQALLRHILSKNFYEVECVGTALEAAKLIREKLFDLIVLDWMLPGLSGVEFLKTFTPQDNRPPVLMITAKAEARDIVQGLEAGADDYVTKPFETQVLLARIKALLRRRLVKESSTRKQDEICLGPLVINLSTYEIECGGQMLNLTKSEFKIMASMGAAQGKVLTRDQLIEIVQGDGVHVTGRTIDTHVFGLRKKLGEYADIIETIRGVGYRIKVF